ncbi:ATP-binding cassette domain-containing protein [Flavobacterium sp. MC2016-06]|jgi:ABC-type multidrug transport system ATPase subunit|uniref:ATP-binding cassette domain-containing protein n=1 Tax=Flavobacterium sp. MC2016-06 TaxID=2676308 RepID=UPI0012BA5ACB|nr:ATP-binding cassette domain-containing protein [Flavobacterium sp. MC2016-06]MBU3858990.1 ATP-binding cassette domain-containing protein [Flavobacterium sp. MC2016-06]
MKHEFRETLLYVENLSVVYDDTIIIKDISLVEKNVVRENIDCTGQVVAFLGRSGRGKSTFFKALTGLIPSSTGKILIKDFEDKNPDAAKSVAEGDIGLVDQKYTLFRHKTVNQALKFSLRKTKLSEAEKDTKIKQYLKEWGLENCADKYPNELSGGQRQRTAIIEQLFSSDQFIVLDEPFSGLDVGNIQEVKKAFELLSNSSEVNTVIFSTHDIELALELAQTIYIIGYPTVDGKLQNYGTIVAKYDLREMGLAWKDYCEDHLKLSKEIIHQMMIS